MPVRDRKFYIAKHNGIVEEENKKNEGKGSEISGEMINKYTDMSQMNDINNQKRMGNT